MCGGGLFDHSPRVALLREAVVVSWLGLIQSCAVSLSHICPMCEFQFRFGVDSVAWTVGDGPG